MSETKRALVITAHDDDEIIGPGGTIRKLANAGVEVTTLVIANGNEGFIRLEDKDRIVAQRVDERAAAQRIIGTARCFALDNRDFENLDRESSYREIIRAVRAARPHVVFTHLPTDYIAHRTLAKVAPEAVWQAGWLCSMDLGDPWKVERLYQFSIMELIAWPSHFVDITDTFDAKLQAMHAYISQHEVVAGVLAQIEAKARAYGAMIGVTYAEAYMRSQFIPVLVSDPVEMLGSIC